MPNLIFEKNSSSKRNKGSQERKEKENVPEEKDGQKHIIYKNFSYI